MPEDGVERRVEFDAWVASRSGALTRFAYLLTGGEIAAERALKSALTVACATWTRVRRSDDPEAEVKRLVVEAYLRPGGSLRRRPSVVPPPRPAPAPAPSGPTDDAAHAWRVCATFPPMQRAAVVLRCYGEMTYPQIAALLDAKESVVDADLEAGFAALHEAIAETRSAAALEAAFRDAFEVHAEDLPDTADRAAMAHGGARRRRHRQVCSAVAVTAVLVGGLVAVSVTYDGSSAPAARPPEATTHPRAWRAESYNGIQLWVPSSWGWGAVPRQTTRGLEGCGAGAYSATALTTNLRYVANGFGSPPYVGRPVAPDATCRTAPSSRAAHVWFDSPLPPGADATQTTVQVDGVTTFTITVADANRTERATILASVDAVTVDAHGCPRDSVGVRHVEALSGAEPSPRLVRSLSFCLFAAGPAHQQVLFYSTRVVGLDAQLATARIESSPGERAATVCLVTPAENQVVLIARTPSVPSVFGVNPGICPTQPGGFVTGSGFHILTEASLPLWAIDGLSLYAAAGTVGDRLTPFLPSR